MTGAALAADAAAVPVIASAPEKTSSAEPAPCMNFRKAAKVRCE